MINRTVYWNTLESTQNIVATSPAVLFAAAAQNHHPGSPELSGPAPPWAACGTLAFPSAVLLPRLGTVSFYNYHIIKLWFLHCTYSIQGYKRAIPLNLINLTLCEWIFSQFRNDNVNFWENKNNSKYILSNFYQTNFESRGKVVIADKKLSNLNLHFWLLLLL